MSRVKGKNTGLERKVFSFLSTNNVYFRRHYNRIIGSPDIAQPRKKRAIFVDGDFWHGWKFKIKKKQLPKYWQIKIQKNIDRDKKNRSKLRRLGWKVMRLWEHDIQNRPHYVFSKVIKFLNQ